MHSLIKISHFLRFSFIIVVIIINDNIIIVTIIDIIPSS